MVEILRRCAPQDDGQRREGVDTKHLRREFRMYTCDDEDACVHALATFDDGGVRAGRALRAGGCDGAGTVGGRGEDFGVVREGGGRRRKIIEGDDAAAGWFGGGDQRQGAERWRIGRQRGCGDLYVRDEIAEPVLLRDAGGGQGLD